MLLPDMLLTEENLNSQLCLIFSLSTRRRF